MSNIVERRPSMEKFVDIHGHSMFKRWLRNSDRSVSPHRRSVELSRQASSSPWSFCPPVMIQMIHEHRQTCGHRHLIGGRALQLRKEGGPAARGSQHVRHKRSSRIFDDDIIYIYLYMMFDDVCIYLSFFILRPCRHIYNAIYPCLV